MGFILLVAKWATLPGQGGKGSWPQSQRGLWRPRLGGPWPVLMLATEASLHCLSSLWPRGSVNQCGSRWHSRPSLPVSIIWDRPRCLHPDRARMSGGCTAQRLCVVLPQMAAHPGSLPGESSGQVYQPSCLGLPRTRSTSAWVGFWPRARRTSPHCPYVIFISHLGVRSYSMKVSLNSAGRGHELWTLPESAPPLTPTVGSTQTGDPRPNLAAQGLKTPTHLQSAVV